MLIVMLIHSHKIKHIPKMCPLPQFQLRRQKLPFYNRWLLISLINTTLILNHVCPDHLEHFQWQGWTLTELSNHLPEDTVQWINLCPAKRLESNYSVDQRNNSLKEPCGIAWQCSKPLYVIDSRLHIPGFPRYYSALGKKNQYKYNVNKKYIPHLITHNFQLIFMLSAPMQTLFYEISNDITRILITPVVLQKREKKTCWTMH